MDAWGWNPATFAAVGTVAAAFTAAIALIISLSQARRNRVSERAAQASLVTVEWDWKGSETSSGKPTVLTFKVYNASALPIFYPSIALRIVTSDAKHRRGAGRFGRIFDDAATSSTLGYLRPNLATHRASIESWPANIQPASIATLSVRSETAVVSPRPLRANVAILFADAKGRRWIARPDGRLSPLESAPIRYGLGRRRDR